MTAFLFFSSNQWKKHWFVLTDQSLRYYKDSIAEEVRFVLQSVLFLTAHFIHRAWKRLCIFVFWVWVLFSSTYLFPQASELDGEIDLSTCYDVKEFPVQRNYGFQILVSVYSSFLVIYCSVLLITSRDETHLSTYLSSTVSCQSINSL